MECPADPSFHDWLAAVLSPGERRRVARCDAERILVSKFEEGFAARLLATVALLPELLDRATVAAVYQTQARRQPELNAAAAWHAAQTELLATLGEGRGLTAVQRAEVLAGIDSVAALLDSVLWSAPAAGEPYQASNGEQEAYREALARMDAVPGIFSRYYGTFAGARVENHCPGAPIARRLLQQAWSICTGDEPG